MRGRWHLGDMVMWVSTCDCNKCEENVMQGNPLVFRFYNPEKVLADQSYSMCEKDQGSASIIHGHDPSLHTASKLMNETFFSSFLLKGMQIK